ncbi:MAG: phage portal protein [Salinisphaera sp.]|nr:phage portal protein [Salinisphaera sp.]
MSRQYQSAAHDRLTDSWQSTPIPADDIVWLNQRTLVGRSREQCQNNDYAVSYLRKLCQNVIGHKGVQLQGQNRDPNGKLDALANQAIELAWANWSKRQNSDITGRQSLRNLANQCIRTAAIDGEFFVRILHGADAGPWGFALQLIDPQRCPIDFDETGLRNGRFRRQGIEFDANGKPLAYLFGTLSPAYADLMYSGRGYIRIPAEEIIHGFIPVMTGQKRGLPWTSTALWRMNMQKGFGDAALVNARASAAKGGWLEWDENAGPEPDEDMDDKDREEIFMEGDPGIWQELPPGLRAKTSDLNFPAGEFAIFDKQMLRGMASGLGVAYNSLANDLENVNYSSIRQGTLDERENWKDLQEWMIESFYQPIFDAWLPRALLSQRITVAGKPLKPEKLWKHREVIWQPRRWSWVDPQKDVNAAIKSVENVFQNPGQIIREQGQDPDTVWRNYANDIESMKAAGIPENFIYATLAGADPTAQPGSNNDPNAKK